MRRKDTETLIFIAVVSGAILAYELLLSRLLAVHYWSYFASMIVSLAMLGFAASGTVLFLLSRRAPLKPSLVPWMAVALAVSIPLCPQLSERIHCMPLVILWNPGQLALFAANYLVLSLPFFFGGFIIGAFLLAGNIAARRVYFANMLGSGAGVLLALLFLCDMPPARALCLPVPLVVLAAWPRAANRAQRAGLVVAVAALALPVLTAPSTPTVSEYKGLSKLLLIPDAHLEHAAWNRFGHLAVVDSRTIRYAPGLSLTFPGRIPQQKAIFTNGDDMETVCRPQESRAAQRTFFNAMLSGAAYLFHDRPRTLIVGSGGGMEVLGALARGASRVDAIENNTGIARLMQGRLAGFAGRIYGKRRLKSVESKE